MADFKARFDDIDDQFLARLYLLEDLNISFDDYSSQSQLILEEYEAEFRDAIVDIQSHIQQLNMASSTTITPELTSQIIIATEAIPRAHFMPPAHDVAIADPSIMFEHLNNWAFTQGFTYVKLSTKKDR